MIECMKNGIVVFDFDGTLTCQQNSMTMWSLIWKKIGKLHMGNSLYTQFQNGFISRTEWFRETEKEFSGLVTRGLLQSVASDISLRRGAVELFENLTGHSYKLYILSGGIGTIIRDILASSISFFEDISANDIIFDKNGDMVHIRMTSFDYGGKATYIRNLVRHTQVPYNSVYYIGNSVNDLSVLSLPIKTICISPIGLSPEQISRWSYECNDLSSVAQLILE